jgi:hypothetical protein
MRPTRVRFEERHRSNDGVDAFVIRKGASD